MSMSKDKADLSPETQSEIRDLSNVPDSDINTNDILLFRPGVERYAGLPKYSRSQEK